KTSIINGSEVSRLSVAIHLSGFLFCVIADAGRKDLQYGKFIKNRILRIAPLATLFVFIAICVNQNDSTPMDVFRLLTLQLNTGSPGTGWGYKLYPMGPIWTIAVEFQFYLIFPFLAAFMGKNGVKAIAGIILAFILIKTSLVIFNGTGIYYRLYHSIIGRLDQLLIGMIAGYFYINGYFKNTRLTPLVMIGLSIIGVSIFMHLNSQMLKWFMPFSFTFEAIFWSFLIYGYVTLKFNINQKVDAALSYLGGLSFSMYLFHLAVAKALYMTVLSPHQSKTGAVINTIIFIIPVTILVSSITYKFIEKPFLELRVKYTK
ncbi:acyltransferase, partial [Enterobacter cloacae]|uniref:acyltransferase family protein n=1 Tax=Enterobacter cloacae TaxID=550 RepID=UPI00271C3B71